MLFAQCSLLGLLTEFWEVFCASEREKLLSPFGKKSAKMSKISAVLEEKRGRFSFGARLCSSNRSHRCYGSRLNAESNNAFEPSVDQNGWNIQANLKMCSFRQKKEIVSHSKSQRGFSWSFTDTRSNDPENQSVQSQLGFHNFSGSRWSSFSRQGGGASFRARGVVFVPERRNNGIEGNT